MKEYAEKAGAYFHQGYNCSQSVVAAFAEDLGISEALALRMSSGFGGGIGRLREVCGAFCGITQVISLYYSNPADPKDKSNIYARVQELAPQFKERSGGSLLCKELLGLVKPEGVPQAEERTAAYYQKRPCGQIVENAADLVSDYIHSHPRAE